MDFAWPDDLAALADEAEAFAAWAVERRDAAGDDVREDAWICGFDREVSLALGRKGWLGMTLPVDLGGGGRRPVERFVVTEALVTAGAPIAASYFADRQMAPVLAAFGTDEQQRRFLPGILAGETTWSIGMSEPDAGSDLAGLRTRAERRGDRYVVDGQKVWTSFGEVADYCYLICRTGTGGAPHEGLSELVVPLDTPGVTVRPIQDMTGARHFCEVHFDAVEVPVENRVGPEGNSWRQTMRQLEHERGGIERLVSNRALHLDALAAADTADRRVRQEAAALESFFRIGRLLVLREVLGQAPRSFSAATKVACTEYEQRVAAFAARAFGPDAMVSGRLARAVCYAPAYTIMAGTSEVLRNVVAERILGLPREPAAR